MRMWSNESSLAKGSDDWLMLSDRQDGSEGSRSSKSNSTIANNLEFVVLIFVPVGNLIFESTYGASWHHCKPHLIGCGDITFRLASIPFKKERVIKSSCKIISVILFKFSLEISKFFVFKGVEAHWSWLIECIIICSDVSPNWHVNTVGESLNCTSWEGENIACVISIKQVLITVRKEQVSAFA